MPALSLFQQINANRLAPAYKGFVWQDLQEIDQLIN